MTAFPYRFRATGADDGLTFAYLGDGNLIYYRSVLPATYTIVPLPGALRPTEVKEMTSVRLRFFESLPTYDQRIAEQKTLTSWPGSA